MICRSTLILCSPVALSETNCAVVIVGILLVTNLMHRPYIKFRYECANPNPNPNPNPNANPNPNPNPNLSPM